MNSANGCRPNQIVLRSGECRQPLIVRTDAIIAVLPADDDTCILHLAAGATPTIAVDHSVSDVFALLQVSCAFDLPRWEAMLGARLGAMRAQGPDRLVAVMEMGETADLCAFALNEGVWDVEEVELHKMSSLDHITVASPPVPVDARLRLYNEAVAAVGVLFSGDVTGTEGGRLGCAWAVNEIARRAIGKPLGGGLSTLKMDNALSHWASVVSADEALPGDVIISPRRGTTAGHVGVLLEPGPNPAAVIASNSSLKATRGQFLRNYSLRSWNAELGTKRKLDVRIYRIGPS